MRRESAGLIVWAVAALLAAGVWSPWESRAQGGVGAKAAAERRQPSAEAPKFTGEEARLVRGSRAAMIAAGFSEKYFDAHFTPVKVVNMAGDRRVVWRFRAGEHETLVTDSIGFFNDRGRRVDTHSVAGTLPRARDLGRTISRRRAERIMRSCIGDFEGGTVLFQPFGPEARTTLVFTAVSVAKPSPPARDSGATTPAATPPPEPDPNPGGDPIRRGRKKGPPLYIGTVDLETGRCVKGRAQAGAPMP